MERIYNYEVLRSPDAGHRDRENDDSTRLLQTQFLNEAVNFVKDSADAVIKVTKTVADGDGEAGKQKIILPYEDIEDLSQREILEIIEKKFIEEDERAAG